MNYLTPIVGFIAGILTTVAFVPQIIIVWRTRSAEDISLGMYTLFTLGVVLWLVYGVGGVVKARHFDGRARIRCTAGECADLSSASARA